MRFAASAFGVLLVLVGSVWFLQGVGLLPGSFMSGQTRWAVYGAIVLVVGVALLVAIRRRPRGQTGRL